jgi:hypothetical protein
MNSKTTALAMVAIVAAVSLITAAAIVNPVFAANGKGYSHKKVSLNSAISGHSNNSKYVKCLKKGEEQRGLKEYEVTDCKEKYLH